MFQKSIIQLIGISIIAFFITINFSIAGDQKGKGKNPYDKMVDNLDSIKITLNLNKDQFSKFKPIIVAFRDNVNKIHEQYKDKTGDDRKGMRDDLAKNKKDTMDKLKTFLTAEQFDKFKQIINEERVKLKEDRKK